MTSPWLIDARYQKAQMFRRGDAQSVEVRTNILHLPARQPFRLELAWLRSQAFRWIWRDGWHYGVIQGRLIKVRQVAHGVEFRSNAPEESLKSLVEAYFRLDQDMGAIHDGLRWVDSNMARLVEQYGAMRILRQDPWECLISYICSQNNNIDRIAAIVDLLALNYGDPLTLDGVRLNSFPPAQRLAEAGRAELDRLNLGLGRGSRIYQVAKEVTQGNLDLRELSRLPYVQAKDRLTSYDGIGPKIADCVCLFSLDKPDAFPVDRHIAAALREHYGKKYTSGGKNAKTLEWARDYFGPHAGYAGQLLFYHQLQ